MPNTNFANYRAAREFLSTGGSTAHLPDIVRSATETSTSTFDPRHNAAYGVALVASLKLDSDKTAMHPRTFAIVLGDPVYASSVGYSHRDCFVPSTFFTGIPERVQDMQERRQVTDETILVERWRNDRDHRPRWREPFR